MYGAAMASTRSPPKQMRSSGSQTTRSPLVWPRPRNCSSTTRLPRSIVIRSSNVSVGRVSPGIDSAPSNSRGMRPCSLAQSCSPRSSIRSAVMRVATIRRAPKALAPSTRTAW